MSSSVAEGTRPPFSKLPLELKAMIWRPVMPDNVSEVAMLTGSLPVDDGPAAHVVIYTAYPVLMHVCREWRAYAISQTVFRYSQLAGMDVPSRPFRPDIDVLYLSVGDFPPSWLNGEEHAPAVRHVATEPHLFLSYGVRTIPLFTYFKHLETISVVLPSSSGHHLLTDTSPVPTRRCRLRHINTSAMGDIAQLSIAPMGDPATGTVTRKMTVSKYLNLVAHLVHNMLNYLRATHEGEESQGRDPSTVEHFGVLAQTFVEYRPRGGRANWVER
ncbi:hypothetical protein BJ170DRAFT_378831 [Xylariales sp. AK1849]|nr:hypothetical protein BJ170DRAFT_378831 [Xylariales sp. AK1849]